MDTINLHIFRKNNSGGNGLNSGTTGDFTDIP